MPCWYPKTPFPPPGVVETSYRAVPVAHDEVATICRRRGPVDSVVAVGGGVDAIPRIGLSEYAISARSEGVHPRASSAVLAVKTGQPTVDGGFDSRARARIVRRQAVGGAVAVEVVDLTQGPTGPEQSP